MPPMMTNISEQGTPRQGSGSTKTMLHDGKDNARRDCAENTQTGQWARQAPMKNRIGRRQGDDQLPQRWHKDYATAMGLGRGITI